jgi:hypothetical protein
MMSLLPEGIFFLFSKIHMVARFTEISSHLIQTTFYHFLRRKLHKFKESFVNFETLPLRSLPVG